MFQRFSLTQDTPKMKSPHNSSSSSYFSMSNVSSLRKTLFSPYLFTLLVFILFFTILYEKQKDFTTCLFKQAFQVQPGDSESGKHVDEEIVMDKRKIPFSVGTYMEDNEQGDRCDIFSGEWVWDESNRPMYEESDCPYIQPQLTCQKHGRPDNGYQNWRWQPHGCSLPSFNAKFMLEKLRDKRMLFVGDSLNRGQYISMVCLLHQVIPEKAKSMKTFGSLTIFKAKDYNATIEFYWAPFLLESNSDDAVIHRVPDRIIRKGSMYKHGRHWQGADIFVFNTYLWWMTGMKMKILHGEASFEDEDKEIELMETEDAYRMTMKSMIKWTERKVDPMKSRVFFTSMSPYHEKAFEWGGEVGGNCYNETTPIRNLSYWGSGSRKGIMEVIKQEFKKSKIPITFVNITQLSEYRKDAHTSIYKKHWNPLTTEQLANPKSYSDCVHWCLPGLQDTWNELLFTKLFYPYLSS